MSPASKPVKGVRKGKASSQRNFPQPRPLRKRLSSLLSLPRSPLQRIEESFSTDLPLESRHESSNTKNASSLSTNPSPQSYNTANTSLISTDCSPQSYNTANSSFISNDSSLQSCHTANASVSSHSSTHSMSLRSSVSLPYSAKSINSYKSRKTVLYRRHQHPPPVAMSSQEAPESSPPG